MEKCDGEGAVRTNSGKSNEVQTVCGGGKGSPAAPQNMVEFYAAGPHACRAACAWNVAHTNASGVTASCVCGCVLCTEFNGTGLHTAIRYTPKHVKEGWPQRRQTAKLPTERCGNNSNNNVWKFGGAVIVLNTCLRPQSRLTVYTHNTHTHTKHWKYTQTLTAPTSLNSIFTLLLPNASFCCG